ncbi:helix-turn-helix domain-containing protein [Paenibacillus sp. p3-SID867]|uniref:helix-turn-helix domain-containing protein n=1 Tax=Paenibacillus sp. p3-SID867 TaxID=2916363 RepID=UPI0021A3026C|nr:helix-turn-helix domain-containing protein [Paenibacillus sp. p3-SID867]MCT1401353.1 helix-turn-helix domain-containing protein [Paenibacillus sp. p3-SID867]
MKRIPMMMQLALILFCIMAIPMAILTWYSSSQILQNSEHAFAETSLAELNANRELNENALNNLSQNTVRLGGTDIFDRIRPYKSLAELKTNYMNVSKAMAVLKELLNLNQSVDGVYSSFFYLDDANYVISTDRGITSLDRYESIDWLNEALMEQKGIRGVWYPRKLDSGVNVLSFALPLNRLSTATRGTIVVNLKESQIEQYLQSSKSGKQGYLLMKSSGTIISHHDKDLLLKNAYEEPFIREIARQALPEGYMFRELNGERLLYAWSPTKEFGWTNVSIYSVDELMNKPLTLQRSIILLTIVIIFAGSILTVFIATWLSKPARELVRTVRGRVNPGVRDKNELVFLEAAFRRMQEEEEGLYKLLSIREQGAQSHAIHSLLRGEVTPQAKEIFPDLHFLVAVVSIDGYRTYISLNNPETRSYHRYLLISKCDDLFPKDVHARCVYHGDGHFAILINYRQEEDDNYRLSIYAALDMMRNSAAELLEHSVTIGVSSPADSIRLISDRFAEAMEAIKQRMIAGNGGITCWKEEEGRDKKYIYPVNSERRILNFLGHSDLDCIIEELRIIRNEIRSAEYVSYDNILFIYHQLVGVTIKHLRENDVSTARIFSTRGNIYAALASIDTLDELEEYLIEFYSEIVHYLTRSPGGSNKYADRIIHYLNEHYREEVVFEEMAKQIGISYSYMRKIVYEQTGKSLSDYLNLLRIEKAKELLLDSNLSIAQIASEVGYMNVRSFNRLFRKFEGMPPSSFKLQRSTTS